MTISVKITRVENAKHYGMNVGDVVEVELDDYVAGVVASEIGNASIQAAKAQAIAARTFAWPFYSKAKTITDSSSTHQAFRAPRIDAVNYPRAVQAAKETSGMLLYYQGKVINTCSYSASNGGRTVSSEERWGGARPWLIAQDDPWDAAAGGGKTGHGVGMSQRGARYAASIGVSFGDILAFYYPGTTIGTEIMTETVAETVTEGSETTMSITAEDLCAKVQEPLRDGWGYVWGTYGQLWTASSNITSRAPESSKKQYALYGKKWVGHRVTDCSGLLYWAFKQLGGYIYHGSDTIYHKYCSEKGKISAGITLYPGMAVFLFNGKTRNHIGVYIGNNTVVEAKGTRYGVVTSELSHWDEWGKLIGVDYSNNTYGEIVQIARPTLRKGSTGTSVSEMQTLLVQRGWNITVDGIFGTSTKAALEGFQASKYLTADGICGPLTWAALLNEPAPDAEDMPEGDDDVNTENASDEVVANVLTKLAEMRATIDSVTAWVTSLTGKGGE